MPELFGIDGAIRFGALHVIRVMAAVWMMPTFNPGPASKTLRLGLGLVLGVSLAMARSGNNYQDPGEDPVLLGVLAAKEITFGVMLGWLAGFMFEAVKVAGSVISVEMGMHMANQVDPNTHTQLPVISFMLQNLALVLFFLAGGPQLVLSAFMRSFDIYPPGSFPDTLPLVTALFSFASIVMVAGIKIAAPVFLMLVVVSVSVGFLAKMAPDLHILEASFPIRIIAGLLLLVIFMPAMMSAFDDVMQQVGHELMVLVEGGS